MKTRTEYNTRALSLIRDCLKQSGEALSAEDIVSRLQNAGERVGKTTVYRNLEKLLQKKQITRLQREDGAYYSYCDCIHPHIHIVCGKCGKLCHLSCSMVDSLGEHIAKNHGFMLDREKTVLYGICGDCVK